jgi:hypothetical protein
MKLCDDFFARRTAVSLYTTFDAAKLDFSGQMLPVVLSSD